MTVRMIPNDFVLYINRLLITLPLIDVFSSSFFSKKSGFWDIREISDNLGQNTEESINMYVQNPFLFQLSLFP